MRRRQLAFVLAAAIGWGLLGQTALAQCCHKDDKQEAAKPGQQQAQDKTKDAALRLCPVTGEPIDFAVKTMTDDGPVYFCGEMALEKYTESPEKYAEKVAEQRSALAQRPRVQVTCPMSGKVLDRQISTEYDGKKVYFCSPGCKAKFEESPAKFKAKLADSYTYQTRCPVEGGEIDPAVYTDLPTGQRVYFCCEGCINQFREDSAKYADALAKQGIHT